MKLQIVLSSVVFLLLFLASLGIDAAERPNIVFVLIDDFGYADSGPYGAKDIRTPNIDRLASEGVKFTDFYANAPVCTPTRCGFITGRWQQRVGFEWAMGFSAESFRRKGNDWVPEPDFHSLGLPTSVPTLPKMLKAAGYATGAFGKWHLGYKDEFNPTKHGFDEYFGELLGHCDYYTHSYYDGTYALRDGLEPVKVEGYLTDLINRRAVEFVRKHASEPFFLYVPHLAVHSPYQPPGRPKPSVTKANMYQGDRRTYAAMVEKVDEGVGMLLAELEKQGVLDNTLFVLSSDNGGERYSDNSPLFHHKSTLWEGGIRVPCLMRWPTKLPKGKVTNQVGITMDLSATFAAISGAGFQPANSNPPRLAGSLPHIAFDGINLLPVLTGEQPEQPRTLCWRIDRTGRQQKAVRHGSWKYIQDSNVEMLFDLSTDIGERRDVSFQNPETFTDLKRRLAAWEVELAKERTEFLVK
ncbi:MAG: sulfatase-like hydrolase/transferase [Planctomycetales bacterium]|nr:sulfatase-like hydrolase/transferase [Planctomycetales bacterium]